MKGKPIQIQRINIKSLNHNRFGSFIIIDLSIFSFECLYLDLFVCSFLCKIHPKIILSIIIAINIKIDQAFKYPQNCWSSEEGLWHLQSFPGSWDFSGWLTVFEVSKAQASSLLSAFPCAEARLFNRGQSQRDLFILPVCQSVYLFIHLPTYLLCSTDILMKWRKLKINSIQIA